jgi:endoglucanase
MSNSSWSSLTGSSFALLVTTVLACSSGNASAPTTPLSGTGGGGSSGASPVPTAGNSTAGQGGALGGQTNGGGTNGNTGGSGATAGAATGGGSGQMGGASGASATGGSAATGGAATQDTPVDALAMVKALGVGTNIGNTLENTITWETGWGQPLITQTYISGMASRGIKTVRVPVAWDTYANGGTIDATKLARVKEVVGMITSAGMYAIVNIHWDNGWIDNEQGQPPYKLTDAIKTKFASYWQQIGAGFADVGHQLILEGMNEEGRWTTDGAPYGPPDIPPLNEMNQLFVTTVRGAGGYNATRALLIAGFNTDIEKTCVASFTVPTDPAGAGKLLLSLHYYTPYQFTILEDSSAFTSWGTDSDVQQLTGLFDKLQSFSQERKIPVILGEFGVTRLRSESTRRAWMTAVAKASVSRGIVPVLWDTGTDISRTDGAFSATFQAVFDSVK